MTNTEVVVDFISKNKDHCDDCLSEILDIKPRQQVNQICNKLVIANEYSREVRQCTNCSGNKLVTFMN